jgi:hypothetical protein
MQDSPAVAVALAHIDAWSHHDWEKTRQLVAPNVHATVTTTQPNFGDADLRGVDSYMEPKTKAARLIEPGSVQVLSAIGDGRSALVTVTFQIRLGPGGTMATMARSCLYLIDENKKIKEERDTRPRVQVSNDTTTYAGVNHGNGKSKQPLGGSRAA